MEAITTSSKKLLGGGHHVHFTSPRDGTELPQDEGSVIELITEKM